MLCGWGVKAGMVYFAGKTVWSMSERIRGSYDDALYKSTYTLLYTLLSACANVQEVPEAVCACSTRCRSCSATSTTDARPHRATTTATGCRRHSQWRQWWTRWRGLRYESTSAAAQSVKHPRRFVLMFMIMWKRNILFELDDGGGYSLRGLRMKLKVQRGRLQLWQGFFSHGIVQIWNILPASVVEASTVRIFKKRLHDWSMDVEF